VVDVKFAAARETIAKEADTARAAAARAISDLAQAQRRTHTYKWLALGFLFGSVLLVCGFAAGYALALAMNRSPMTTTSVAQPSAAALRTVPASDIAASVRANLGGQNEHR
jgi:CHASE3 domain sensor protein